MKLKHLLPIVFISLLCMMGCGKIEVPTTHSIAGTWNLNSDRIISRNNGTITRDTTYLLYNNLFIIKADSVTTADGSGNTRTVAYTSINNFVILQNPTFPQSPDTLIITAISDHAMTLDHKAFSGGSLSTELILSLSR